MITLRMPAVRTRTQQLPSAKIRPKLSDEMVISRLEIFFVEYGLVYIQECVDPIFDYVARTSGFTPQEVRDLIGYFTDWHKE